MGRTRIIVCTSCIFISAMLLLCSRFVSVFCFMDYNNTEYIFVVTFPRPLMTPTCVLLTLENWSSCIMTEKTAVGMSVGALKDTIPR